MRRLSGYGPLRQEPVKHLLQLPLKLQILWALQDKPHKNIIGIAVGVILHQGYQETQYPVLSFIHATQPRRISQTISPSLIRITRQHSQGVGKVSVDSAQAAVFAARRGRDVLLSLRPTGILG